MYGRDDFSREDVNNWPNPFGYPLRSGSTDFAISGRRTSERTSGQWRVVDWQVWQPALLCFSILLALRGILSLRCLLEEPNYMLGWCIHCFLSQIWGKSAQDYVSRYCIAMAWTMMWRALPLGGALSFSCSVLLSHEAGQPISRLWQMWIFQGMSIGVFSMSSIGAMVDYAGWFLLSNVSDWPRLGHFCLIGYAGYDIFGRRTSESTSGQFRAVDWQAVSRRVSRHVSRHVGHFSSPVLWVGCCWLFLLGGVCCVVCVLVCGSRGALADFFLTSSSRDMTATVLSNAALEKKPLVLKGSRPCGGVRARMPIEQFSFSTWLLANFVNQNMTESCLMRVYMQTISTLE